MIIPRFDYPLMKLLCEGLQTEILNFHLTDCLSNDLRAFFLIFEKSTVKKIVYFSFIPPFARFHFFTHFLPQCSLPHPLQPYLQNAILKNVQLLNEDRILELQFQTPEGERLLIAEFFNKHPNFHLLSNDQKILFSLHPLSTPYYQSPIPTQPISHMPHWKSHLEVENGYWKLEKEWEFLKAKQALQRTLTKQLKRDKKKEAETLIQIEKSTQWQKIQHEGELIKYHLSSLKKGDLSAQVSDWTQEENYTLHFDPLKTPREEMAERFKKAKKLQAGIAPLNRYLLQNRERIQSLISLQTKLEQIDTDEQLRDFKRTHHFLNEKEKAAQIKGKGNADYREYFSATGYKIWVGKNEKNNDRLSFQLANGRDWWLHVKDYSGSHVIIKMDKNQKPDSETLADALQLALYYSKAKESQEADVCYTQRKYISKLGKKPGLVQISQHQTARVRYDPLRFLALKDRRMQNL